MSFPRTTLGAALTLATLVGALVVSATAAAGAAPPESPDAAAALDAALAGTPVPALAEGESFSTTATVLVGEAPGTSERSATRTCTATGCTTVLAGGEVLTQGAAVPARAGVAARAGRATTPRFLFANGKGPARWNPCRDIYWRVRPNNLPAGGLGRLGAAVQKISAASGLAYRYAGATSFLPFTGKTPREAANLYVAVATPAEHRAIKPGVWGYGTVSVKTHRDGVMEVVKGYMMLNRAMFGMGPAFPVANVLEHELGHTVNLDHVDNYTQIMNPYATNVVDYGSVDRAGLRRVGRPAGCIRSR
jgi:hypothetical protein